VTSRSSRVFFVLFGYIFLLAMPYCMKCQRQHERPVGKKCGRDASPDPPTSKSPDILHVMTSMEGALRGLIDRVEALEARARTPVPSRAPSAPASPAPASPAPSPPQSPSLRRAAPRAEDIAARVSQHMREYGLVDADEEGEYEAGNACKIKRKSGRVRTTADTVVRNIPWPHFGVFKGPDRKPASYDSLTLPEFVGGYARIITRAEPDTQKAMLLHLVDLMEDAAAFPFQNVRNFHGIVLGLMEQDELGWHDEDKIQKLRQQYCRIPDNSAAKAPVDTAPPCPDYQLGKCEHKSAHDHKGSRVQHICAWCFRVRRKHTHHPENLCITKRPRSTTDVKND
jgi:hypothetical protein